MKIVKRSGVEEVFDREKITRAIEKANEATEKRPELSKRQIEYIVNVIEDHCNEAKRALSVEEIQELVETHIILQGAPETAKRYIRYRFTRNLARQLSIDNMCDNVTLYRNVQNLCAAERAAVGILSALLGKKCGLIKYHGKAAFCLFTRQNGGFKLLKI